MVGARADLAVAVIPLAAAAVATKWATRSGRTTHSTAIEMIGMIATIEIRKAAAADSTIDETVAGGDIAAVAAADSAEEAAAGVVVEAVAAAVATENISSNISSNRSSSRRPARCAAGSTRPATLDS